MNELTKLLAAPVWLEGLDLNRTTVQIFGQADQADRLLKVLDASDRLVAQFPVTTGSSQFPLPIGQWKVTTYAFTPPFIQSSRPA